MRTGCAVQSTVAYMKRFDFVSAIWDHPWIWWLVLTISYVCFFFFVFLVKVMINLVGSDEKKLLRHLLGRLPSAWNDLSSSSLFIIFLSPGCTWIISISLSSMPFWLVREWFRSFSRLVKRGDADQGWGKRLAAKRGCCDREWCYLKRSDRERCIEGLVARLRAPSRLCINPLHSALLVGCPLNSALFLYLPSSPTLYWHLHSSLRPEKEPKIILPIRRPLKIK